MTLPSLLSWLMLWTAPLPVEGGVARELRFHELRSEVFGNTRTLRVLLPRGYDSLQNRNRRYPVLYLNDGQNLFDVSTSVMNPLEWRVDETVDSLIAAGRIPPMIVVGIDNAGRRGRFREYFPWVDQYLDPPEPNPQGTRYPAFLVDEVIPFVESRYRAATDARLRGIGGSSAGALAALNAVVSRPGVFGALLVESPSLYVDDFHILRNAANVKVWPARIFLGAGTNEEGRPSCDPASTTETELVRDIRRLARTLHDAGVDSSRVRTVVVPCAVHNETAWAERFPAALEFLYSIDRPGR
jgi:predicted alpha/beta superfamily hydrolase